MTQSLSSDAEKQCQRCGGSGYDPDPINAEPRTYQTIAGDTLTFIEGLGCSLCNGSGVLSEE
jgi:DnaJ-class molecular chaperone